MLWYRDHLSRFCFIKQKRHPSWHSRLEGGVCKINAGGCHPAGHLSTLQLYGSEDR